MVWGPFESQLSGVPFKMHITGLHPNVWNQLLLGGNGVRIFILGSLLVQNLME